MLEKDNIVGIDEVLLDIYCKLCLGEFLIKELVQMLLENLFFKEKCYDLVCVGCYKVNKKFGLYVGEFIMLLMLIEEDVVVIIEYLVCLYEGQIMMIVLGGVEVLVEIDDIDYFGNCCLCMVGELI